MMRKLVAAGTTALLLMAVPAAEARTPSKGKAERFLENRFGSGSVDGVQATSADATCVRPRSTRTSHSTRCVIQIVRADSSVCDDARVIVRYRSKRSSRMVARGFNPECTPLALEPLPGLMPPGPPPVVPGGPPPSGQPGVPPGAAAAMANDRSLKATARASATFLYCTNWEVDPWYGAYYVYACFYDLGFNFQADIYYYTGNPSYGAYWWSFLI